MIRDTHTTKELMGYKEIGEALGVTRVRARAITMSALKKLAHPSNRERLQELKQTLGALEEERARALGWTKDF